MIECSLAQECEGERKGTLAASPSLHWDSLPLTLLRGLSHWLTVALPCRPLEGCGT